MTYRAPQVLHGAEGVWAHAGLVVVWQGGRTLNTYRRTEVGEYESVQTKQYMQQPERERVQEDAEWILHGPEGAGQ